MMKRNPISLFVFGLIFLALLLPLAALAQNGGLADVDSAETLREQARARAAERETAVSPSATLLTPQNVDYPLFVGVDDAATPAYQIDVITNNFLPVFSGVQVWGAGYDEVNNVVYFNSGATLYEWPVGGVINQLGVITDPAGATQSMVALAFYDGTLYGTKNIANEAVYIIDPVTQIATVYIDYVDADYDFGGLAIDPNTGEFYATNDDLTPFGSGLFRINLDGTATFIAPYPAGQTDLDGLAISPEGLAYLVPDEPGLIYVYDLTAGAYVAPLNNPWTTAEVFSGATWIWEPTQYVCNTDPITIPSSGAGTPYPSTITVSGYDPAITDVNVQLVGLSHTWPDDIDILLVGPEGENLVIMSDAGGSADLVNVDLIFDDAAPGPLPDSTQIISGTYQPTDYEPGDTFDPPAPTPSTATTLATFNGTNPNGDWHLYIMDDTGSDLGQLTGGWCLQITAEPTDARLAVAHLAPFAPGAGTAVTVTLNATPVLTNFVYGDSTPYLTVPAGSYDVAVFPAGSPTPAITGTFTLTAGLDYSVIAMGDGANQPLELLALLDDNAPPAAGNFKLRLGHLASFAAGNATADVRLQDGTPVLTNVNFGDVATYLELPAGAYDLKITTPGGATTLIDPAPATFGAGDILSAFATGDGSNQDLGVFAWPSDAVGFFLPLAATIAVAPTEIAVSQAVTAVVHYPLTISNIGASDLNWTIEEDAGVLASAEGLTSPSVGLPPAGTTGSRGGVVGAQPPITYDSPADFSEDFADITNLPGWFMQNNSAPLGSTGWFQGNSAVFPAHAGAPTAYIGANFNNTSGVGTISNWLLTPELALSNGDTLSFWTRTAAGSTWPDRLQVRLSTAGASTNVGSGANDVGDFTTLLLDINDTYTVGGYPEVWTQFTVTLSGIPVGTTGRFALRYYVENAGPNGANSNYIGIDTVEYVSNPIPALCDLPTDIAWVDVSPTSGTTAAGDSSEVTVTFDTTGLTAGNTYTGTLCINSNDLVDPLVTVPLTLTVIAQSFGVEVAAEDDALSGDAGTTVTYTVWITNTGNVEDTFVLTATGVWNATPSAASVTLAAGASTSVMVTVDIPANAADAETDVTTFTATSQADDTATASVALTTTAVVPPPPFNYIYLPIILKP
ncbi:MAG: choice-of-anchor J domain-containing protein [Anaerolineae bacterium]|nr:choice-of-anchor J domain-containing protein [Anaerolineae bacterium]